MKRRQKVRKGLVLVSFFLFPATFFYFSPAIIIIAANSQVVNGSFIMFAGLLVNALILGRAFCGWICPAAGCQEALFAARDREVTKGDYIKWVIWIPWIIAIAVVAVRAGGYEKVDFFFATQYGMSVHDIQSFFTYLIVLLLLIVLPAMAIGKRSFCHHLCWMAPFMIIGRGIRNSFQWPSLQLAADPKKCVHCHVCSRNCPMSLPVESMVLKNQMENSECILCGSCIDDCKSGSIRYAFRGRR